MNRTTPPTPRNILIFGIDSVRATALPSYGNTHCLAPHSERMAERGAVISHCFAQVPKCIPNRSCMLTGRYPHVDGLRALKGKAPGKNGGDTFVITRKMPNILPLLRDAGYTLCHKGCNHIVDWDAYEAWFDHRTDWDCPGYKNVIKPQCTIDDDELMRAKYAGPVSDDFDAERCSDAEVTRQMVEFIRSHDTDRPFFAYLDLRTPHPPYRDWPVFREHYDGLQLDPPPKTPIDRAPWTEKVYRETYDLESMGPEKWGRLLRAYYSGVSFADMLAGRVLDALEECNMADNTIVIYTSDHGDFAGEHGCTEKHDPILYDSLTRMPFIIQLPPDFPRGRQIDAMMEQIDLAPTIMELCGLEIPRWIQGRSLAPLLEGRTDSHREFVTSQGGVEREAIDRRRLVDDDHFYGSARSWKDREYYLKQKVILDHPDFMMRAKMIRTRRHKYIYRLNGHHEFYDLECDPHELTNRIADPDCAGALEAMRERLIRWMIESETNLPLLDQVYA